MFALARGGGVGTALLRHIASEVRRDYARVESTTAVEHGRD